MNRRPCPSFLTLVATAVATFAIAGHAKAQVVIDDTLPVSIGTGNQGSTGLAIVTNYDASASDKLVVVVTTEHAFGTGVGMAINSVEYNGQPMIEAVQENTLPGTAAIFYLDNPGTAGEIRIIQGNQNGGWATVYALSNTAPGVAATGQSTVNTVDVTTALPNSLVIAGILDGGQAANGNGAGAPTAVPPLLQTNSGTWGNMWGGHCTGHQVVVAPGIATSTFNTAGPNLLRAVAAAFTDGCVPCTNGATASILNLGGGTIGTMSTTSNANLGCNLNWSVTGATPNAIGAFAAGLGVTTVPLSVAFAGCPGTIHTPNPAFATVPTDAAGMASLVLPVPPSQSLCGLTVTTQYAELQAGACPIALTDAITITIGN